MHSSLKTLAFRQIEGDANLVCSRMEELALASNSFDAIVAGDMLQIVSLTTWPRCARCGGC